MNEEQQPKTPILLDPNTSYRTFTISIMLIAIYAGSLFATGQATPFIERMVEAVVFYFIGREAGKSRA